MWIGIVIGGLAVYAVYRHYQSASASGANDQLPAQSEMAYYSTPPTNSVQSGIPTTYVHSGNVSQTITNQPGKKILYNGQPQTYPTV